MLAGLAFCEMLSQYPQSAFQGSGSPGGVQQQFATQNLRVHLLGLEISETKSSQTVPRHPRKM